jgi:type IV pilus assembly protein PilB
MTGKMRLGELLVSQRVITQAQLTEALKKQEEFNLPLGEVLIRLKYVTENVILDVLSKHLEIDFLNIAENDYQVIDRTLANILPMDLCQRLRILPVFQLVDEETRILTLAMADPLDERTILEVERLTECVVEPVLTTSTAISGGIGKLFSVKVELVDIPKLEEGQATGIVNKILVSAVSMGASDIHIEPHAKQIHIRMRVDGVMQMVAAINSSYLPSVVSRIKIMASEKNALMKIEEKRLPQDGAFSRVVGGHAVDMRVSSFPTIYGEKIVIRLFDKDRANHVSRISDLDMSPPIERVFRQCIKQPSGITIVTGPTGSGKTTTLNAVINEINDVDINIVTIEDPVEYHAADFVNQSSLMPAAGYTYSRALRAIMRQDPDVILIGEVRDLETAQIAVQAALTGHRVFTTLHTEDAAGAVVRMVDIGVENFLVSSTLVSAINQRLVRKLCPLCAVEYTPGRDEMLDLDIDEDVVDQILNNRLIYNIKKNVGCNGCRNTGFKGRQAVFELLNVTPTVRELILKKQTSDVIARKAREEDPANLIFEEGLRLVLTGVTALDELKRLPRGEYKLKSVDKILRD